MDKDRKNKMSEENKKDLITGNRIPHKEVGANLPFSSDKEEACENLHDPQNLEGNI